MTGSEIIKRAYELRHYVYWYGGKRQKCTQSLLNEFAKDYPNIYTSTYISKCKVDIKNNEYCCDCSGLVCYAYKIGDIGSYYFPEKYKKWTGTPKNGMILHRNGHVALYNNGYVVEMRGVDYDFCDTRKYVKSEWLNVLYDPNVDYDEKPKYEIGWHQNDFGWWYADTTTSYLKDGFYKVKWSKGEDTFYFTKEGYMILTDSNGVVLQPTNKI